MYFKAVCLRTVSSKGPKIVVIINSLVVGIYIGPKRTSYLNAVSLQAVPNKYKIVVIYITAAGDRSTYLKAVCFQTIPEYYIVVVVVVGGAAKSEALETVAFEAVSFSTSAVEEVVEIVVELIRVKSSALVVLWVEERCELGNRTFCFRATLLEGLSTTMFERSPS